MKSCMRYVRAVSIVHYYFVIWYAVNHLNLSKVIRISEDVAPVFKGQLRFLTFWNVLLQATFFTVCFLNDITSFDEGLRRKKKPLLGRLQDTLMTCLAFPLSMFVGLTFWGLYFVDRELVLPRAVDEFFPTWLNHCMHTNIMIFILLEMVFIERQYPSRSFGLAVLTSFMVVYLVWIHVIFSYTGMWVYPVLDVLSLPMRLLFFGGLLSLSMMLYFVGEMLNQSLWGDAVRKAPTSTNLLKTN